VRLGHVEGELVCKDELFSQIKEELTEDAVEAYVLDLRMSWPRLSACILRWTCLKRS